MDSVSNQLFLHVWHSYILCYQWTIFYNFSMNKSSSNSKRLINKWRILFYKPTRLCIRFLKVDIRKSLIIFRWKFQRECNWQNFKYLNRFLTLLWITIIFFHTQTYHRKKAMRKCSKYDKIGLKCSFNEKIFRKIAIHQKFNSISKRKKIFHKYSKTMTELK